MGAAREPSALQPGQDQAPAAVSGLLGGRSCDPGRDARWCLFHNEICPGGTEICSGSTELPPRRAPAKPPRGCPQPRDRLRCHPAAWGRGYLGAGRQGQGGLRAPGPAGRSSSVLLAGASPAPAPAPRFLIFRTQLLTQQQPRRVQGEEVAKNLQTCLFVSLQHTS